MAMTTTTTATTMAPGFRFYPTEEELLSFYLPQKLQGRRHDFDCVIPEHNLYEHNPWDLPQLSGKHCCEDPQLEQWFFFVPRHKAKGGRPNRLTPAGYWKAVGSPTNVYSIDKRIIGVKRIRVFYTGRAQCDSISNKTEWKMNDYVVVDQHGVAQTSSSTDPSSTLVHQQQVEDFSVCRVYKSSKIPRAFDRRPSPPSRNITISSLNQQSGIDHHQHHVHLLHDLDQDQVHQ